MTVINERLVDLTHVGGSVLAVVRSAEHVAPGAPQGFQWVRFRPQATGSESLRCLGSSGDVSWAKLWLASPCRPARPRTPA